MSPPLRCTGITKSYRRTPVLTGVDLTVDAGTSTAIVGENGSGKTTLIDICAGVRRPDAGAVARSGAVGYCPQVPGLIDLLTIDDHLRLAAAGCSDRQAAMGRMHDLLDRLGVDATLPMTATELSGGQRQKLNVGLAVADDPTLLLLDEPYQGFDHGSYLDLWDVIDHWTGEGRAVVVITHLLAEADRVDRVLTMSGGVLR
ncbi:MAG: ABC transporter ATP-binding protein [Actinomycetota bacterium]